MQKVVIMHAIAIFKHYKAPALCSQNLGRCGSGITHGTGTSGI